MPSLDFELLDDVLLAYSGPSSPHRGELVRVEPTSVGPLVELALHRRQEPQVFPSLADLANNDVISGLRGVEQASWATQRSKSVSLQPLRCVISRIPPVTGLLDPYWVAFQKRAQLAAREVLPAAEADRRLAGILGELVSNVWDHSEAPTTAVVG